MSSRRAACRSEPAVCPSGWVYNQMGEADDNDKYKAYCCARCASSPTPFGPRLMIECSGFEYASYGHSLYVVSDMTHGCARLTSGVDSMSVAASTAGSTLLVHEAWAITWYASDTPGLTPQPPTMTNRMLVPTWTPGEVIPDGKYDQDVNGQNTNHFLPEPAQWFLMVGMPVIGAVMIGSCIFCRVRSSKKKRRARRAAKAQDAADAAGGGFGTRMIPVPYSSAQKS